VLNRPSNRTMTAALSERLPESVQELPLHLGDPSTPKRVSATDAAVGIAGVVDVVRCSGRVRNEELVIANLGAIPVTHIITIPINFRCGHHESIPDGDDFTSTDPDG
jgi:hypothetical protein